MTLVGQKLPSFKSRDRVFVDIMFESTLTLAKNDAPLRLFLALLGKMESIKIESSDAEVCADEMVT